MEKLVVKGPTPLKGEVTISGAKNAAVAILPATLLIDGVCTIENLPNISDIKISCTILEKLKDEEVEHMLRVLNDPNVVITAFGDPSIVRKITPAEYSYQSPSNIGPVELDYVKTVTTSHHRVYQFIASDKLRDTNELIVILNPRGTDRIIYRIYDYQTYVSNEIRNANNPALPAIHAFERYKFVEYQPVQGRIEIKNPSGLIPETYDFVPTRTV